MLKFLGCESGFGDEHTSAYFITSENELVIIDCPVSTFQKVKNATFMTYKDIYVLITHTHGDHIGGLGLFTQFAFFMANKPIIIVAPSNEVAKDIQTVLQIEGNELSWFKLITASELEGKKWFGRAILTEHSPQLKGKCFGYQLCVEGRNCVYTGDTATLEPFIEYLKPKTHLYVDVSANYGIIHLKLEEVIPVFKRLIEIGVEISLMHLDDTWNACKILGENNLFEQDVEIIFPCDCE